MEPEIVGKRIKKLMEIKNITSQQLSKKMDIDINSLNKKLEGQEEFYLGWNEENTTNIWFRYKNSWWTIF